MSFPIETYCHRCHQIHDGPCGYKPQAMSDKPAVPQATEGEFVMPPECCERTKKVFGDKALWCIGCGASLPSSSPERCPTCHSPKKDERWCSKQHPQMPEGLKGYGHPCTPICVECTHEWHTAQSVPPQAETLADRSPGCYTNDNPWGVSMSKPVAVPEAQESEPSVEERIRQALEKMTPEPWEFITSPADNLWCYIVGLNREVIAEHKHTNDNANGICTLRNLVPQLLSSVESLKRERDDSLSIQHAEKKILLKEIEDHTKTKAELERYRTALQDLFNWIKHTVPEWTDEVEKCLNVAESLLAEKEN